MKEQKSKEKAGDCKEETKEEEAASEEEVIYEEEEEEEDFVNDEVCEVENEADPKNDAEENLSVRDEETLRKMKVDLAEALHKEYICKECVSAQLDVINVFDEGTFSERDAEGLESVNEIMENVIEDA